MPSQQPFHRQPADHRDDGPLEPARAGFFPMDVGAAVRKLFVPDHVAIIGQCSQRAPTRHGALVRYKRDTSCSTPSTFAQVSMGQSVRITTSRIGVQTLVLRAPPRLLTSAAEGVQASAGHAGA